MVAGVPELNPVLPQFRQYLCTRCGACLLVCPTQFIVQGPDYPLFDSSQRCTQCRACEVACPAGAIEIPFTVSWS
jgi:ferredoxin